jgi:protein O-mannosyl-transferase
MNNPDTTRTALANVNRSILQKNRKGRYITAVTVALLTFLVYLPTLRNEFVSWDDDRYILENHHIRSMGTGFFRWAFFDFYASNWHPLTWISHAVDYALWGLNPLGHHLTNIILHAVNTALVILLAVKLLDIVREGTPQNAPLSFLNDRTILIAASITGLLFGLHPVHVESVAWVMERKDLLCALFFLLSIIWYTSYVGAEGAEAVRIDQFMRFFDRRYLMALGLFILALLSKPMVVTLPVVLLILDWYPLGRIRSFKTLWGACIEKIPFVTLSLASSVITIMAQRSGGAISSLDIVPLSTRLLVAVNSLVMYLGKMLLPLNLIPFYPYPWDVSLFSLKYWFVSGLVLGITASCVVLVRKQKFWLSAWGYYVVTLIPVLGIVQVGAQSMADRYTYLPSLGPFIIAGLMVAWLAVKMRELLGLREYLFSAAAALIIFVPLSYATVRQIHVWHDSISLWDHVLENEPSVYIAYGNRGVAYTLTGRYDKALEDFNAAVLLGPNDSTTYYNRGAFYLRTGRFELAIADIQKACDLGNEQACNVLHQLMQGSSSPNSMSLPAGAR